MHADVRMMTDQRRTQVKNVLIVVLRLRHQVVVFEIKFPPPLVKIYHVSRVICTGNALPPIKEQASCVVISVAVVWYSHFDSFELFGYADLTAETGA